MHTVRRALALVAAVLVAALGIGLLPARPAAAAGGPFDCQPGLYQVISGQLKLLNPVAGVYTDIGTAGPTYNALGYNVEDDHLYAMGTQSGVNQGHLLRIASDGSVTSLGVPTNLPVGSYVAGDFDDQGNLLIRANATTLYSIDVSAGPPVATPLSLTGAALNGVDLVWIGDALYSTDGDLLYRVDLATLVVTTVAVSGLTSGQYGAAWSDQPDNLYVSNNATGVISQITGFTGPTPAATARVTATITSNNDGAACKQAADPFLPPAAANDAYAATVDVPLVVPAATGILDNDTGTGLTVQSHTQPSHGTVTVNADGSFAYTPAPGYLGPDSFTYVAVDRFGVATGTAMVDLTVQLPPPPDAVTDTYVATSVSTLVVPAGSGTLVNDTGTSPTVTTNTQPSLGVVVVAPDGSFSYQPSGTSTGPDSFTYTICDPYGQCDTGTVNVTVGPPPPPVADDDAYTATADTTLLVPIPSGVLIGDTGTSLSVTGHTQPGHGTVTVHPNGSLTYEPDARFHGTDTFTYTVCDAWAQCDAATVTVTVQLPPPPTAGDGTHEAPGASAPLTVGPGSGVLTGITGADTRLDSYTQPTNGRIQINLDGSFTYTPNGGFSGTDVFTYTVIDRYGRTATATVQIVVPSPWVPPSTTPPTIRPTTPADDDLPETLAYTGSDSTGVLAAGVSLLAIGMLALLGAAGLRRRTT
jgi:hypothetical protein